MQWEYTSFRVETSGWFAPDMDDADLNRRLAGHGTTGWELVSVVPVLQNGYTHACVFILKRPRREHPASEPFPGIVE